MALSLEYFDAAGTAAADGVFVPVAALPGVLAAELAAAQSAGTKEGKALFALLNQALIILSPTTFNKLGFTAAKATPNGAAADVINQSFTFTWQKLVNLDTDTVGMVPEPSTGANSGLGSFSVSDVYPGAVKVASGGAVSGAGVVIQTAGLTPYGSLTHAGLTISGSSDNRDWFAAFLDHCAVDAAVRSTTVASAITAASVSAIGATTIPAAYYQATDPLSGIAAADVPKRGLITRTLSYTLQLLLNQSTQTFDVNVVTA